MFAPSGLSLVTNPLVCEFCLDCVSVPETPAGTIEVTLFKTPEIGERAALARRIPASRTVPRSCDTYMPLAEHRSVQRSAWVHRYCARVAAGHRATAAATSTSSPSVDAARAQSGMHRGMDRWTRATVNPGLAGACVVTCTQSLPPFTLRSVNEREIPSSSRRTEPSTRRCSGRPAGPARATGSPCREGYPTPRGAAVAGPAPVTPVCPRRRRTLFGLRASTASCCTTPVAAIDEGPVAAAITVLSIAPGVTPAAVAAYRTCGWSGSMASACMWVVAMPRLALFRVSPAIQALKNADIPRGGVQRVEGRGVRHHALKIANGRSSKRRQVTAAIRALPKRARARRTLQRPHEREIDR